METLQPLSHHFINEDLMNLQSSSQWSKEENKMFEKALAIYTEEDSPDRWFKIAEMIPGKSVVDVMNQYNKLEEDVLDIESGRVPIPGYPPACSSDPLGFERDVACRKRSNGNSKGCDQERRKGVPWTEEEHRRFLLGLLKYGKGDWRNISRNFVVSKTPTQVASHAQKYYQRQISGTKDKRRPSIHDITTVNLLNANLMRSSSEFNPDLGFNSDEGMMFSRQNMLSESLFSPSISHFGDAGKFTGENCFGAGG